MVSQQVILIRQFFTSARRTVAPETPFVLIRRLLHLDLCVELALNALLHDHGTPDETSKQGGRRDLPRHELWELAEAATLRLTGKSLPERQRLKTLHEIRNLAQHRGTVPNADEVTRLVEPVRSLLEFVTRDLYGAEFEGLQEWHALECKRLSDWITECVQALDEEAPFGAAIGAKLGYEALVECVQTSAAGPDAWFYQRHLTVTTPEIAEVVNELLDAFKKGLAAVESELIAVSLGLNVSDHYRFLRAARAIRTTRYGDGHYDFAKLRGWPKETEAAHEEAQFMVEYLGQGAVLLENTYPGVFENLALPGSLAAALSGKPT